MVELQRRGTSLKDRLRFVGDEVIPASSRVVAAPGVHEIASSQTASCMDPERIMRECAAAALAAAVSAAHVM